MAPSRLDLLQSADTSRGCEDDKPTQRTIYLLEEFPPEAVAYCQTIFKTVLPTDDEICNWRQNADAILVREIIITRADIQQCRQLQVIGKQGTGTDIIDSDACADHNIAVLNTPGINAQAVAELVLALTMAVARQLCSISVKQVSGGEARKDSCNGVLMGGKTIGILGMGAIGTAVARIFQGAFGSRVYVYDPYAEADAWKDIAHTRVHHFEEMLPVVDILTIHVPLTSATRGMIGIKQMRAMKSSAILMNAARGGIVNESDLLTALNEGAINGAGLDCHEYEPPTLERYGPLWATERVVSTPHIGAATASTRYDTAMKAIKNVEKYFEVRGPSTGDIPTTH